MTFDQFDLDPRCLTLLHQQGIVKPTPVQKQAIPIVSSGHDLIATAQTGTGKTLGFALPTLTLLAARKPENNVMLVLVPTRELAVQVHSVIRSLCQVLKMRSVAIYGGVGFGSQNDALRRGCSVIVATPGRLLDHMSQGTVRFHNLQILILDEADRMLDMGFLPDIKRIVSKLPKKRQTLMFSATFPPEIDYMAREMLKDPQRVTVGQMSKPVETVRQLIYTCQQEDKMDLLLRIIKDENPGSTLIFLRTKHRTDRIGRMLKKAGFNAAIIHGDRTQGQRQDALDGFKKGTYQILVATDVAARGIDVEGISHVINFDIPETADAYIHRVGRTGRNQAEGDAITLVTPDDRDSLRTIEKKLGHNLPRKEWEKSPQMRLTFEDPQARPISRTSKSPPRGRRGRKRPMMAH
ncbi:MAG: DEAD/DEAH box helicase [Phycisphaerae bacterium]